jgi:hypothetical protein
MDQGGGVGPRRSALLDAWRRYAGSTREGPFHDFGSENRYQRVHQTLREFLDMPTEEAFEALWTREVLRDAVMGGPELVLTRWPGSIEELADRLRQMRDADEYDPAWEREFITKTAVREAYGYMDPETRPILSSSVTSGLDALGFPKPTSYVDRDGYDVFAEAYQDIVGHATQDTEHEVPWYFEIEQFLVLLGSEDRTAVLDELPIDDDTPQLTGWHAEGQAGRITFQGVDPLLEKYIETKTAGGFGQDEIESWGGSYWENWKWTHAEHIQDTVRATYDITDLHPGEVEPFLNQFKKAPSVELSSSVPTYLLGGRSGGILWSEFKSHSEENAEQAATVLSTLFDESQPLRDQLTQFNDFYAGLETSGGPLLSLATVLLMLAYPDRYIMYKYGKFSSFFDAYSDYDVETGFDAQQYWVLNEASERLRRTLDDAFKTDDRINTDASMLDVHTLIWVAEGVENI